MSKIIQLLILSSLCTLFTYAMDVNSTNEIINKATEAVKELEVELNSVVNDVEENLSAVAPVDVVKEKREELVVENNVTTKVEDAELSVEKGDPKKGKNIFKYVLKEDCNMTAFQFAEKHSQEEWIEILEEKKIKETIFESCPNVEKYYQERWTDDLYQFFYEASNEDEIPEC